MILYIVISCVDCVHLVTLAGWLELWLFWSGVPRYSVLGLLWWVAGAQVRMD